MSDSHQYIPFSQRAGLSPIPPQLKLGQVSDELRRLLDYSISKEVERASIIGGTRRVFSREWKEVATDLHVIFFRRPASSFVNQTFIIRADLEKFFSNATIAPLFDLVEFLVRHSGCSQALKGDLADAFVNARAAYRIIDSQIVAIGVHEQGRAFEAAISHAEAIGALPARNHLIRSGLALRNGDWADSVRESIHAVEAMSRKYEPSATTLGPALKALERRGHIHGSLKAAFEKLYGYTNDEGGIRHALLDDVARVDEVDALFMVGVCASFVSYLISRDPGCSTDGRD